MKKILIIIIFSFIFTQSSYADHCGHDVDREWEYTSNKSYASWTFKNKTDKSIVITHIGLNSKDQKTMADVEKNINLKPFGVAYGKIYVGDLNLDVAGTGFTRCRYGKVSAPKKYVPLNTKNKSGSQKFLDKILGN